MGSFNAKTSKRKHPVDLELDHAGGWVTPPPSYQPGRRPGVGVRVSWEGHMPAAEELVPKR